MFKLFRNTALLMFLFISLNTTCISWHDKKNSQIGIHVNQIGFSQEGQKLAIVPGILSADFFSVVLDSSGMIVYSAQVPESEYWDKSGEDVSVLDFSNYTTPGKYYVVMDSLRSPVFEIKKNPFRSVLKESIRYYYLNRVSTAIEEKYAGKFTRPFTHPDTIVFVHNTAASAERPAGTVISSPGGWYDAGDYNKYVVNSGITTFTLLTTFDHFQPMFAGVDLNIPESANDIPDLLDEILWNVKWMETMQDPKDGGVYHKMTTANFEGFVFPTEAKSKRFVTAKGTAAALNFAAVMAKTSRVMVDFDREYADNLLKKAILAWEWAENHPNLPFVNPKEGDDEFPPIRTGEYGDKNFEDEFFWAGVEMFLATGDHAYLKKIPIEEVKEFRTPGWNKTETLGLISLLGSEENLPSDLATKAKEKLLGLADELVVQGMSSPYRVSLNDFPWGSNGLLANECMVLINAFKITEIHDYYDVALSGLDYMLGRNATGYCFVTGFGEKYPMNIHHRQTATDGIAEPFPGMLAGGPNPRNIGQDCDAEMYPVTIPAKCFIDEECSYSTNEVAINWNAPLVYVLAFFSW